MNGLRAQAPRLLKTVGGKPWARRKDHEDEEDTQSSSTKRKSPTPIDADPKGSSDIEADPASSSDEDVPISSADIPGSFDPNGKSLGKFTQVQGVLGPKRRSVRSTVREGAHGEPPRKLQRISDDEGVDIFGAIKRKRSNPKTFGTNKIRDAPRITYANPDGEVKGFVNPLASYPSTEKRMQGGFKKQFLSSSNSNDKGHAFQDNDSKYPGAEDYRSCPEQSRTSLSTLKRNRRSSKIKAAPNLKEENPPSSAPEFRVVESLTQAVHQFDRIELEKEREEDERREREQAALAYLSDEGQCPMRCGKILPRRVLETLGPSASIKEQQKFCRKHQIEDAEEEWEQRGYPIIDLNMLPKRLERYNKSIMTMITKPDGLHFRKEMEERNKKGRDRTLLQHMKNEGLEGIGVGYYGASGLDIMTDYIMKNFAGDIRKRAGSDKVIAARGAAGYVQMVLVLELAMLLVKEDMGVHEVQARKIMNESTAMGDLLHPSETGRSRVPSRRAANSMED